MTGIDTREIAETLMLDATRRVADFIISDRVYAEVGDQPEGVRLAISEEIRELIDTATVTITWPEESQ
jgi:hypothetical protein